MSAVAGRLAERAWPKPVVGFAVGAFARAYGVDFGESADPAASFRSFDAFFTRRLRPGLRPVDTDPNVLVSPADGMLVDAGAVDPERGIHVKGACYAPAELLRDEARAAAYQGGAYFVVYLSPRDYHRVHAPCDGRVVAFRHIAGLRYPVNRLGDLAVPDPYLKNERVAIYVESETFGVVAVVMVGAMIVGRITLSFDGAPSNGTLATGGDVTLRDPPRVAKADEIGVFHLGSSAVVLVPPRGAPRLVRSAGERLRLGEKVLVA